MGVFVYSNHAFQIVVKPVLRTNFMDVILRRIAFRVYVILLILVMNLFVSESHVNANTHEC